MNNTIFDKSLNDFARKYLVLQDRPQNISPIEFSTEHQKINSSIFEQLLLFDKLNFKVYGENIPLIILLNHFGMKGFEQLLEENAIEFTLWTPVITYSTNHIAGIHPLQYGNHTSDVHIDPKSSIYSGFKWLKQSINDKQKKIIYRKLRDKYIFPTENSAEIATTLVKNSYSSGKFDKLGFNSQTKDLMNLNLNEKKQLCECANSLLEYDFLIKQQLSSYGNNDFFNLFIDTKEKIHTSISLKNETEKIFQVEKIPDFQKLFMNTEQPFQKILEIRKNQHSKKFRKWLYENKDTDNIVEEYLNCIQNTKGFFETKKGKLTKTVILSTIGGGIGALIAGPISSAIGASAAKTLEPLADMGLDLLDEYVISGLTKGWHPRLFINTLKEK